MVQDQEITGGRVKGLKEVKGLNGTGDLSPVCPFQSCRLGTFDTIVCYEQ